MIARNFKTNTGGDLSVRVNIYQEEMTDRVELVEKNGFTGVRFYMELPVALATPATELGGQPGIAHIRGPFVHKPQDDDSAAVTFWGKRDLDKVLRAALQLLEDHNLSQRMRPKAEGDANVRGTAQAGIANTNAAQPIGYYIEKEIYGMRDRLKSATLTGQEANALRTAVARLDSVIVGVTSPVGI